MVSLHSFKENLHLSRESLCCFWSDFPLLKIDAFYMTQIWTQDKLLWLQRCISHSSPVYFWFNIFGNVLDDRLTRSLFEKASANFLEVHLKCTKKV
jgi:hypothetical protein